MAMVNKAVYRFIVALILVGGPGSASAWLFGTEKGDAGVIVREATLLPENFKISAGQPGVLLSLEAGVGQAVSAGQIVAKLDESMANRALEVAQADIKVAEKLQALAKVGTQLRERELNVRQLALKRVEMQRKRLTVTQDEVDFARAQVQAAKSALEEGEIKALLAQAQRLRAESQLKLAIAQLSATLIRSPGEGEVTAVKVAPGEVLSPGQPLLWVQRPGRYQIRLAVDHTLVGKLELGKEVRVSVDDNIVLAAKVGGIAPGLCISETTSTDSWCQFASINLRMSQDQVPPDRRVKVFIKSLESQSWPESLSTHP
ncbi:MAG: HlyD family secretion protein [Thiotrichales bacterium]